MPAIDAIKDVLQTVNPSIGRYRSWSLEAGQDLFGHWTARVSFGRVGCRDRTIAREIASEDDVWAFLHKGLMRRRTTFRRCGTAYRMVYASPEPTVVITLATQHYTMLARNLIYTALK